MEKQLFPHKTGSSYTACTEHNVSLPGSANLSSCPRFLRGANTIFLLSALSVVRVCVCVRTDEVPVLPKGTRRGSQVFYKRLRCGFRLVCIRISFEDNGAIIRQSSAVKVDLIVSGSPKTIINKSPKYCKVKHWNSCAIKNIRRLS